MPDPPSSPTRATTAVPIMSIKSTSSTQSTTSHRPINATKPSYHCAYKMPRNPKYECARAGTMYQKAFEMHYCSFHDGYAKDRCQALVRHLGHGSQCSELATSANKKSGRRLCEKHTPNERVDKWMTQLKGTAEEKIHKVKIAVDLETENEFYEEVIAESVVKPAAEWSPSIAAETTPIVDDRKGCIAQSDNDDYMTLPQAESSTNPIFPPLEPPISPTTSCKLTPVSTPGQATSLKAMVFEERQEHIAAMYVQCNICLEKHAAAVMSSVPSCGHLYRGLCLDVALRKGDARRYNCSGCRAWIATLRGGCASGPSDVCMD